MNNQKPINVALALVGLLALGIYILACTSFSPDDTKILYPAFDAQSGVIGMAVYDRETKGTEMLFLPLSYQGETNKLMPAPSFLRAGWLPSGREIVVSYLSAKDSGSDKDELDLALIPWGMRKAVKVFRLPEAKEAGQSFLVPLCLVGERAFLQIAKKGIARVDLRTGALATHQFKEGQDEVLLYPAPDGKSVFCFEPSNAAGQESVFARLNPDDFSLTPIMAITNDLHDLSVLAYDKTGRTLAFLGEESKTNNLFVLRDGQQIFARSLDTGSLDRSFGNAILNPNGKGLWATFQESKGTNAATYGLMEIPFSDAPPHEVKLISNAPYDSGKDVLYFQFSVSHDAKTAAICSTYLSCTDQDFKAADCALFLVDLSDPKWPVTKVPIPMPASRPDLSH